MNFYFSIVPSIKIKGEEKVYDIICFRNYVRLCIMDLDYIYIIKLCKLFKSNIDYIIKFILENKDKINLQQALQFARYRLIRSIELSPNLVKPIIDVVLFKIKFGEHIIYLTIQFYKIKFFHYEIIVNAIIDYKYSKSLYLCSVSLDSPKLEQEEISNVIKFEATKKTGLVRYHFDECLKPLAIKIRDSFLVLKEYEKLFDYSILSECLIAILGKKKVNEFVNIFTVGINSDPKELLGILKGIDGMMKLPASIKDFEEICEMSSAQYHDKIIRELSEQGKI